MYTEIKNSTEVTSLSSYAVRVTSPFSESATSGDVSREGKEPPPSYDSGINYKPKASCNNPNSKPTIGAPPSMNVIGTDE